MGITYLDEKPKEGITYLDTPIEVAKSMAKEYGPYFATGLGEDAAVAASLFPTPANAFGAIYANQLLQGKTYSGAQPEAIQKGIEKLTGEWPQPKTPSQSFAKYAGNVTPLVPPALYAASYLPPSLGYTAAGWLAHELWNKGSGILGGLF